MRGAGIKKVASDQWPSGQYRLDFSISPTKLNWLLATGYWLLATGYWLLATFRSRRTDDHLFFVFAIDDF